MENEHLQDFNDSMSNDPEENLRMENEILHLKLQAELGAKSQTMSGISPEIENQFLKNVLEFEHAFGSSSGKKIKVYDILGKPDFKPSDELSDDAIEQAFEEITTLLFDNNIEIDYSGTYDDRTKYRFITEELFEYETDDFSMPGMIKHFSYEEFHPNHKLDIENRTIEFLSGWFDQRLDERRWEIADFLLLPDGKQLSKLEFGEKMKRVFDCYTSFIDCQYFITDISFQLQKEGGMGHSEGSVKYTAILENGEKILIEDSFKIYLSLQYDWWSIFYFVLPGFEF